MMETPQQKSHVQHFEGARYQSTHPAIREDDENEAPTDSDTSLLSVSGDEAGPGTRSASTRHWGCAGALG